MFQVTKTFRFEAAHQLLPGCHSEKCSDCVHGHSYKVELCLQSLALDKNGMVLDFGLLKPFIDNIDSLWDHALLLPAALAGPYENNPAIKKLRVLRCNPTAENLAELLYALLTLHLHSIHEFPRVLVKSVRLWETETCSAEYVGERQGESRS